jgi:hypothetical protein
MKDLLLEIRFNDLFDQLLLIVIFNCLIQCSILAECRSSDSTCATTLLEMLKKYLFIESGCVKLDHGWYFTQLSVIS